MKWINSYLQPGVYRHLHTGALVVVTDVITHTWSATHQLHELAPEPLVIWRPLIEPANEHVSNATPLCVFTQHHELTH
jgi:hypothetical protein